MPARTPQGAGRVRRVEGAVLVGVLALAACLRLRGLGQGLPYLLHPDEAFYQQIVQRMLQSGDPNPHFLTYPSFFFYAQAALSLIQVAVGRLTGTLSGVHDLPAPVTLAMGVGYTAMPSTLLLARLLSVAAGLALVALAWAAARRMSGSSGVGLLAGALVAVSPTAVQNCRSMTADPLGIFWLALALWGALGIVQRGAWRDYILAAMSAGLAASSKYNLALGVIALGLAHLLRHGWHGLLNARIYVAALLSAVAFFAATPYALLDWRAFVDGLGYQAHHYSTGHSGLEGDSAKWYLAYLWQTHGPAMLLAPAEGIRALVTRDRPVLLVAGFSLFYLVFISLFTVRNPWTIMPVIPFLLVLAASGWGALVRWLPGCAGSTRWRGVLGAALAAALVAAPATHSLRAMAAMPAVDSRVLAARWIADKLPAGAHIAVESYSAFANPKVFQVQGFVQFNVHPPEWYIEQGFEYLVFGKGMYGRYYADPTRYTTEVAQYDALFAAFELLEAFPGGDYDVRIYATGASVQPPDAGVGILIDGLSQQPG